MATAFNSSDPGHDADRQACQGDSVAFSFATLWYKKHLMTRFGFWVDLNGFDLTGLTFPDL